MYTLVNKTQMEASVLLVSIPFRATLAGCGALGLKSRVSHGPTFTSYGTKQIKQQLSC